MDERLRQKLGVRHVSNPFRAGRTFTDYRPAGNMGPKDRLRFLRLCADQPPEWPRNGRRRALPAVAGAARCVSAWNKDPVFGVIGIQSGPRG